MDSYVVYIISKLYNNIILTINNTFINNYKNILFPIGNDFITFKNRNI